jgi:hypothetical protein
MSKELPFFKFNATEWITGNISYESFELQGAFISVCAEYWNRNNDLTIDEAKLRLRNAEIVDILIQKNYLKTKKNKIVISFLDKERKEIESKRLKLSESGRKGGLSKAKASLKQGSSIKEEDKDKEIRNIFIAPTLEQVESFCLENNLELEAEKFVNFYESKGWIVGKTKMKNWKAAVRNWAKPKQPKDKRYEDMTDGEQIAYNMRKRELEYANKTR